MESKNLAVLFLVISLQALALAQEDKTEVVGIIGESLTLKCDLPTSDPPQIAWKDLVWNQHHGQEPIFNSTVGMDIAGEHLNKANLAVNEAYELILTKLFTGYEDDNEFSVSSSGDYFCYSYFDGKWHSQTFFLSLAEKPQCSGSTDLTEGESTMLRCAVKYVGTDPTLQWYRNGEKIEADTHPDLGEIVSTLDINGATYVDDEAIYTCTMALNENQEDCQTELSVKYPVREMNLTPMDDVIEVGTDIQCSARGNPQPKITFTPQIAKPYSGKGYSKMQVDKSVLHQLQTVTCTAENTFDGKLETIEKSITFNVTVPRSNSVTGDASHSSESTSSPGGNAGGMIAGIIIGALVLVIIIIAIVCLKRKESEDREKDTSPPGRKDELLPKDSENKV